MKCAACEHDANLECVLRDGYSDFADHIDSCPVTKRRLAKEASDAAFHAPIASRMTGPCFSWPDSDFVSWVDYRGKLVNGTLDSEGL